MSQAHFEGYSTRLPKIVVNVPLLKLTFAACVFSETFKTKILKFQSWVHIILFAKPNCFSEEGRNSSFESYVRKKRFAK